MPKLTEEELITLSNNFSYRGLLERYHVMEKYFDIKRGDTIIDGGSYAGDMTQYFSKKVGKNGTVHAFEAHPINVRILRSFIKSNKLDNVIIHPIALWDEKAKIPFYISNYSNACSPIRKFKKVSNEMFHVNANTLDDILGDSKVDFIWSNIEASECRFLRGAKNILSNNSCKVIISTHKVTESYKTTEDIISILNEYGYNTKSIDGHSMWVYAEK